MQFRACIGDVQLQTVLPIFFFFQNSQLNKRDSDAGSIWKILKNTFFPKHLQATA